MMEQAITEITGMVVGYYIDNQYEDVKLEIIEDKTGEYIMVDYGYHDSSHHNPKTAHLQSIKRRISERSRVKLKINQPIQEDKFEYYGRGLIKILSEETYIPVSMGLREKLKNLQQEGQSPRDVIRTLLDYYQLNTKTPTE